MIALRTTIGTAVAGVVVELMLVGEQAVGFDNILDAFEFVVIDNFQICLNNEWAGVIFRIFYKRGMNKSRNLKFFFGLFC